jgi:hypothetical protein
MTELLLILAFILFCSLAVWVNQIDTNSRCTPSESVRTELLIADQRIASEFHRACHAMNDAAGQSWRNLAG